MLWLSKQYFDANWLLAWFILTFAAWMVIELFLAFWLRSNCVLERVET